MTNFSSYGINTDLAEMRTFRVEGENIGLELRSQAERLGRPFPELGQTEVDR